MTVKELVQKYEAAQKTKKPYFFNKHLKRSYMPYAEKLALVKSIIDNTSYVTVGDKQVYRRNTNDMIFVLTMQLIEKYTDIEFSSDEVVKAYDTLMESGVMDPLMSQIPEGEVNMLRSMLDIQRDDVEMNTRSLISFFETKADAVQIMLDEFSNLLNRTEVQAKINEVTE